jgi:dihydrofolate reductase
MILAVTSDGYIGVDNDLCIKSKTDMKFFKETTVGSVCIMGRRTYESIKQPLTNRTTYVVPNTESLLTHHKFSSLHLALSNVKDETNVFIIGGAGLFIEGLNYVNTVYLTIFDQPCSSSWLKTKSPLNKDVLEQRGFVGKTLVIFEEGTGADFISGHIMKFTRGGV